MSSFSLGSGIIDFLANDAGLQTGLRAVESSMARLQYRMNEIGNIAERAFAQGREAIAGAFQAANDFETQMAKVQTVMQKNTQFQAQFSSGLKQMSVQFGISTKDLSNSLYDILSAGIAPANALKVLAQAAQLSIGGFADMRTTTRGLTAVMNAYQVQAQDVTRVSDQMYQAVIQGKLEFEDLARVMGYIAPFAHEAGVSLDDMLAALSTMTNTGASAQQAATQLLNFIKAFIRPSKQSAAAAKQFGIELGHNALQGENFAKTLEKLRVVSEKYGPEALGKIFPDIRGARGILALLDNLQQFHEFSDQMKHSTGAAGEAFKTMSKTGQFQMNQLKQSIIQVSIAFGQALQPMLLGWAQALQTNLPAIISWISAHQEAIQVTVKWAAAILGLLIVAPRVVASIRLLSFAAQLAVTAFRLLGVVIVAAFANPLVTIAVAAMALFTATMIRSQLANETWEQSAYGVLRALGLFHGAAQNLQAALESYGLAANEAVKSNALFQAAQAANKPIEDQISLLNDAVQAQQRVLEAAKEAQRASKEAGQGEGGYTDAFIEAQRQKLLALQKQQEELSKKKAAADFPQFDFNQFMKKFPGLEGDVPVSVAIKPEFRGVAELADVMQKAIFGTEFDPSIKANTENTHATKDNTEALKMLGDVYRQTGTLGGFVLGR